jgi:hypothetical protein
MHYRNGREAKNGDKIVQLAMNGSVVQAVGTLINATPGNDHCNGEIIITGNSNYGPAIIVGACLCDCLHVDDLAVILTANGLGKRPSGK